MKLKLDLYYVITNSYTKGVEPRRGEIGPVADLNKYSIVK